MKGPPSHWTTLKKLIYLKAARGSGPSWIWQLLTGTAPLTLLNAIAHPIHSLTQYGKCEQPAVDYLATVTQSGKCEQESGASPTTPKNIKCNNGVIKVSRNLCDVVSANIVVGKYINPSGVVTDDTNNFYYDPYVPVTPGETYTMAMSGSIWYFSVMQYDSAQNFLRRTVWGGTNTPVGTEKSFSVGSDCAYIRFGSNMKKATITEADVLAVNWMLTETAEALLYRPYKEIYYDGTPEQIVDAFGNVATAPPLLGVGSYADTLEFLAGALGRQVSIKVFDGTEAWTKLSGVANAYYISLDEMKVCNPVEAGLSTHFVGTAAATSSMPNNSIKNTYSTFSAGVYKGAITIRYNDAATQEAFAAVLAAQFRAGTPVIAIIPLATATTESVTGQMLVSEPLTVTAEVTVPTLVTTTAAVSTPDPKHPLPVWCNNGKLVYSNGAVVADGTPEVLTVEGKNLFTGTIEQGNISSSTGENTNATTRCRTQSRLPVKPSTEYTISCVIDGFTSGSSKGIFVYQYLSDGSWITSGWKDPSGYTFTTNALTESIRVVFAFANSGTPTTPDMISNVQLEYGDTATAYQPYHAPQTASVPDLFGAGDYKDEVELVGGLLTHKIGVKVLTGQETGWQKASTRPNTYTEPNLFSGKVVNRVGVCSHFVVSDNSDFLNSPGYLVFGASTVYANFSAPTDLDTVQKFKAWLASEYANGTPVIVLYPLATETTESTTPQSLHTSAGTNVVEVSAAVTDVTVSVEYAKAGA